MPVCDWNILSVNYCLINVDLFYSLNVTINPEILCNVLKFLVYTHLAHEKEVRELMM